MLLIMFWVCFLLAAVLALISSREGSPGWANPVSYILALVALGMLGFKVLGFG